MAVAFIKYWFYVTQITGVGSTIRVRWDQTANNWGTTLDATQADFESTNTNEAAATVTPVSTGWHSINLDPATVALSGTIWIRLSDIGENNQSAGGVRWTTADGSVAFRPYLEVKLVPEYPQVGDEANSKKRESTTGTVNRGEASSKRAYSTFINRRTGTGVIDIKGTKAWKQTSN